MSRMIVKLQITRLTSEKKPQCLVYDQSRKFYSQFDADKAALKLLGKNQVYKAFWLADYDELGDKRLNLLTELTDQGW